MTKEFGKITAGFAFRVFACVHVCICKRIICASSPNSYSVHRLSKDHHAYNTGVRIQIRGWKYLWGQPADRPARWHPRRSITWICDFVRTRVKSQCRHISCAPIDERRGRQVYADRIVCNIVSQEGQAY